MSPYVSSRPFSGNKARIYGLSWGALDVRPPLALIKMAGKTQGVWFWFLCLVLVFALSCSGS